MVFSSSVFLLYFLPVFFLIYSIASKEYKNYIILIASIFFYAWGAPKFVFVIVGSTLIDFQIVKALYKSKKERIRKLLLFLSVFTNLGLLAFFKYANFFVDNVNHLLVNLGFNAMPWVQIALPIGISFYTFQTLTYSIDVYRGTHVPLKKPTDYLLYIMSFPQMIAGPIVRFNSIADDITNRVETVNDKLLGIYRFCIGLAKKVLVANVMAQQADAILNGNLADLSTPAAWAGILAYAFQIYFDFSGYSDMAIGLGKMMGFRFPENFESPYTATSISEFWRRWHITLGGFMRDYLYIPLGGNRVSTSRLYFNLWLVFLLSGLWHGASWNFVIWGAYHGFFLIIDRLFLLKFLKKIGKFPATIITFFIVIIGWVVFRIENMTDIWIFLERLFAFDFSSSPDLSAKFCSIFIIAVIFSFLTSFKFGQKIDQFVFKRENYSIATHITFAVLALIALILSISSITTSGFNPFIYFRF